MSGIDNLPNDLKNAKNKLTRMRRKFKDLDAKTPHPTLIGKLTREQALATLELQIEKQKIIIAKTKALIDNIPSDEYNKIAVRVPQISAERQSRIDALIEEIRTQPAVVAPKPVVKMPASSSSDEDILSDIQGTLQDIDTVDSKKDVLNSKRFSDSTTITRVLPRVPEVKLVPTPNNQVVVYPGKRNVIRIIKMPQLDRKVYDTADPQVDKILKEMVEKAATEVLKSQGNSAVARFIRRVGPAIAAGNLQGIRIDDLEDSDASFSALGRFLKSLLTNEAYLTLGVGLASLVAEKAKLADPSTILKIIGGITAVSAAARKAWSAYTSYDTSLARQEQNITPLTDVKSRQSVQSVRVHELVSLVGAALADPSSWLNKVISQHSENDQHIINTRMRSMLSSLALVHGDIPDADYNKLVSQLNQLVSGRTAQNKESTTRVKQSLLPKIQALTNRIFTEAGVPLPKSPMKDGNAGVKAARAKREAEQREREAKADPASVSKMMAEFKQKIAERNITDRKDRIDLVIEIANEVSEISNVPEDVLALNFGYFLHETGIMEHEVEAEIRVVGGVERTIRFLKQVYERMKRDHPGVVSDLPEPVEKAIGGAVVAAGIAAALPFVSKPVVVNPVQAPTFQSDLKDVKAKAPPSRGLLRPKFITPSTDILDISEPEKQLEQDEWDVFNYIPEGSYGAEGTPDDSLLKAMNHIQETMFMAGGGGVDLPTGANNSLVLEDYDASSRKLSQGALNRLPNMESSFKDYQDPTFIIPLARAKNELYDNLINVGGLPIQIKKSTLFGLAV